MLLKINGIAQPGIPVPPSPYQVGKSFGDNPIEALWNEIVRGHNDFWSGHIFDDKHVTVQNWITDHLNALIQLLNANSPEIIALAIVICAAGIMLGPLIGGNTSKWFGRLMLVFWSGVMWRVLLV